MNPITSWLSFLSFVEESRQQQYVIYVHENSYTSTQNTLLVRILDKYAMICHSKRFYTQDTTFFMVAMYKSSAKCDLQKGSISSWNLIL